MRDCEEKKEYGLQALFMELLHRYTAMNYKRIMDLGVHPKQFPFLRMIDEQEGISQSDLAAKLHVKPPTVAVTVKRLEKSDLIYRRPDQDDMRVSRIYLTEKGKSVSENIAAIVQENEKVLTEGFTEEELAQFQDYFIRVIKNTDQFSRCEERRL